MSKKKDSLADLKKQGPKVKLFGGVDNGQKGGIAWIDDAGVSDVMRMPLDGKDPDLDFIDDFFEGVGFIVLERAQAMRGPQGMKQGMKSLESYIRGAALIEATLRHHSIRIVRPQEWQKKMLAGARGSNTKEKSIWQCQKMFPDLNLTPGQCRKKQDGMADAMLMACYAKYLWNQGGVG